MDDLATHVGVSRRTLFNHVPSKLDAVLGAPPEHSPELLEEFVAGGPTGHLMTDLKISALKAAAKQEIDLAEASAMRALIRSDPRLFALLHERFAEITTFLADLIGQREGNAADPMRTEVLLKLILGLFDTALDQSLADTSLDFNEHFERVYETVAALFDDRA